MNRIEVKGPLIAESQFNVEKYNETNLADFFTAAIHVNHGFDLSHASIESIKVHKLQTQTVQDIDFDRFHSNLYSVLNSTASIRKIRINNHVFFQNKLLVDKINGLDVEFYLSTMVKRDDAKIIGGVKSFSQGLTVIGDVLLPYVNGKSLNYWFNYSLSSTEPQVIEGYWKFDNLKVDYFAVKQIGDVKVDNLVIVDEADRIYSDIYVDKLIVSESCTAPLAYNLQETAEHLRNPYFHDYDTIIVKGSAIYSLNFKSKFTDILNEAVTVHSNQPIYGKVVFVNRPTIDDVRSPESLINGVNILDIYDDALKYEAKRQVVTAPKRFIEIFETDSMLVDYKLDTPYINNIDIVQLNNSIYRKGSSNYVSGYKTFTGALLVKDLIIKGTINDVNFNDIVFIKDNEKLNKITGDNIHVKNNLILRRVNDKNFDQFLESSIKITGPAQEIQATLTVQNLKIDHLTWVSEINNVKISSLVFRDWDKTQLIIGKKRLNHLLTINGPIHVINLNGINFLDHVEQNVKLDDTEYLPHLELSNSNVRNGIYVVEHMNNRSIAAVVSPQARSPDDILPVIPTVKHILQDTNELVRGKVEKHFMYLDFADNIQVQYKTEGFDNIIAAHQFHINLNTDCPEDLNVKVTGHGIVYIQQPTNSQTLQFHSDNINLNCTLIIRNCQYSNSIHLNWIVNNHQYNSTYVTTGTPMDIKIFSSNKKTFITILELDTDERVHIEVLQLINPEKSWTRLQDIETPQAVSMNLLNFNHDKHLVLIVAKKTELEFYLFNPIDQWFESFDKLPESYDLISDLIVIEDEKIIALSQKQSKIISIFKFVEGKEEKEPYVAQFFQRIRTDKRISSLDIINIHGKYLSLQVVKF